MGKESVDAIGGRRHEQNDDYAGDANAQFVLPRIIWHCNDWLNCCLLALRRLGLRGLAQRRLNLRSVNLRKVSLRRLCLRSRANR